MKNNHKAKNSFQAKARFIEMQVMEDLEYFRPQAFRTEEEMEMLKHKEKINVKKLRKQLTQKEEDARNKNVMATRKQKLQMKI